MGTGTDFRAFQPDRSIPFDPRFNVYLLPFIYDSYDDADEKFDGAAGEN